MKLAILAAIIACSYTAAVLNPGDLRKAFEHHEKLEDPQIKMYYYGILGGEDFVRSERWKNYQKYSKDCPAIAEVVKVVVSKTSDGGDYVIEMSGPSVREGKDGFTKDKCSLWIKGGSENKELDVGDFTSY